MLTSHRLNSLCIAAPPVLLCGLLLGACAGKDELPSEPQGRIAASPTSGPANLVGLDAFTWSEPVWLGPVVNSPARDWRPVLSSDRLRLYFHSNRGGGLGGFDIWVSRRAGGGCPWETPVNLGPPLNTARDDGDPEFTPDGRVVFYSSVEGHGGAGRGDILISRRADPHDDFAWEQPVNLGPHVNTDAHESNPAYVAAEDGGTLYFERALGGNPANSDIYKVSVSRDGRTRGPAVLVPEVSAPAPINDNAPTVRADGRELIFWSNRPEGVGLADLWVSTRRSVNDAWSAPRNLGTPVNSEFADLSATLSHDGRTLFFTSAQQRGGLGLQDMWMSTRGPSGGDADATDRNCTS